MMVERSPGIENMGPFLNDLSQATEKLTELSAKSKRVLSPQELKGLITALDKCNDFMNSMTTNLGERLVANVELNAKIEQALKAVLLFQKTQPERKSEDVERVIISLFSSLDRALDTFNKNTRDLKKYKIGRRVEKIDEMNEEKKQSGS